MNTKVTYLKDCVDSEAVKRLFSKFAGRYGSLWTGRIKSDEDWVYCHQDWLEELSCFHYEIFRKAVNDALAIHKDFPPTLGQLVDLCLKADGIPSQDEIINLMVRREFNHPLVKMIYEKIGSWTLSNGKADEISKKTRQYYDECLNNFRCNEQEAWDRLTTYSDQKLLEQQENDVPRQKQHKSFSERMAEYMELANSQKLKLGIKEHPIFAEEKLKKSSIHFDKELYAEYKKYLLSVEETLSLTLPIKYAYDRVRFLREIETFKHLQECGYTPAAGRGENVSQKRNSGPRKAYTNWVRD